MNFKCCKIEGTGKYLPQNMVSSAMMDERLKVPKGWSEEKSGVKERYFVEDETASYMAARAAYDALADAGLELSDIDCIVGTSGTMEQPIPCNAALVQEQLGLGNSGIACFDINSTCLSFLVGLDMASYLIDAGRYKKILLVASDITSVGLNWEQKESSVLFGDGAAAVIVGSAKDTSTGKVIACNLETYSDGAHLSEIRGGGNRYHPREYSKVTKDEFLFDMNGRGIFKLTSELMEGFVARLLEPYNLKISDMKMVIPHQASQGAMRLIRKRLGIESDKFMSIVETHGNVVAASLPMALHEAIREQKITRGDKVMLLGTSAGLSLGGLILEY